MKDGCKVKICGITNIEDAGLAAREGADYLGVVVEVNFSPRSVTIEEARDIFSSALRPAVALVYEMSFPRLCRLIETLRPAAVQFLSPAGEMLTRCKAKYPGVELWQSLHLPPAGQAVDREEINRSVKEGCAAGADVIVFDTAAVISGEKRFGGTGHQSDWSLVGGLVRECPAPAFLAGGINPDNVRDAVGAVRPYGIDLCSGVEVLPGKKSVTKLRALMKAVRGEDVCRESSSGTRN